MSKDLIVEQIERRARLEHGGDFEKAAREYFRDHPGCYEEFAGLNRRIRIEAEQYAEACILAARYPRYLDRGAIQTRTRT